MPSKNRSDKGDKTVKASVNPRKEKSRNPSNLGGFGMVPVVGLVCGGGYRAVMLALRAAHSALPQSRFAAKRRTAAFCRRSVESLPSEIKNHANLDTNAPHLASWGAFWHGEGCI